MPYGFRQAEEIFAGTVYCREERELWYREQETRRRLYEIGLVPVDSQSQTVTERHFRSIINKVSSGGDIGEGMFYVAGARGNVFGLYTFAEQFVYHFDDFIYGYGLAAGDIYDFALSAFGPGGQ